MWQSVLCLGVGWLLYRLALRQERCFDYNRRYLLLLPVLAAVLPLLPLPAPWKAAPGGILEGAMVYLPAVVVGAELSSWSLNQLPWLGFVYCLGVTGFAGRLGWQLVGLWRSTHRLPREVRAGYVLVRTGGVVPTSSFGRLIFWDETIDLTPAEVSQILRHELAHVRQGHTWERLALEGLRALLWFNPFVHLLSRALELTHEYLADEEASNGMAAPAYAALLARQAATRLGFAAGLTHSFVQSFTLNRIAMLYRTSPVRSWKKWLIVPLSAATLLLAAACQQEPEPAAFPAPPKLISASSSDRQAVISASPDRIYTYVEEMPLFPTGNNDDILTFLQSKMQYPAEAVRDKVQGKVFVSFIIGVDGQVRNVTVTKGFKGLRADCDEAAVAAVQQLPRFTPGKQNGQPVAVSFTVAVQFKL